MTPATERWRSIGILTAGIVGLAVYSAAALGSDARSGATLLALASVIAGLGFATQWLERTGRSWSSIGLRRPASTLRLGIVTAVGTTSMILMTPFLVATLQGYFDTPPNLEVFATIRGSLGPLVMGLLLAWTVAAVGEELIFRGFILSAVEEAIGGTAPSLPATVGAVVYSGCLAALVHTYQGLTGAVTVGVLAVGFATIYLVSGRNLWGSILAHGVYDSVALVRLYGA